jgi:hypothetical protein
MHKTLTISLRIIVIIGLLVFLYHVFTYGPVPRWTYYVFTISMLLVVAPNTYVQFKKLK